MDSWHKKYVGKTTFFFAIFLHIIIPFTYVAIAYISTTICSSSYEQIIVKKLMKCSRFTYQEGITCVLADEDGKEHTALFYELNFDSDIKEIRAHLAQS